MEMVTYFADGGIESTLLNLELSPAVKTLSPELTKRQKNLKNITVFFQEKEDYSRKLDDMKRNGHFSKPMSFSWLNGSYVSLESVISASVITAGINVQQAFLSKWMKFKAVICSSCEFDILLKQYASKVFLKYRELMVKLVSDNSVVVRESKFICFGENDISPKFYDIFIKKISNKINQNMINDETALQIIWSLISDGVVSAVEEWCESRWRVVGCGTQSFIDNIPAVTTSIWQFCNTAVNKEKLYSSVLCKSLSKKGILDTCLVYANLNDAIRRYPIFIPYNRNISFCPFTE